MGDFNIDWFNKSKKRKLKMLMTKFDFTQHVKGATRITKSSKTQIDLIFTNKEERILKSYNLLTGMSDHNMTLMVRKLSNKRFVKLKKPNYNSLIIPKNDVPKLDNELKEINWFNMVWDEVDSSCRQVMNKIDGIMSKYLKKRKSGKQRSLPWINEIY